MGEGREHRKELLVEPLQLVAVEPQRAEGGVEGRQHLHGEAGEGALVDVQSGCHQPLEGVGVQTDVSIPVQEQMHKVEPAERELGHFGDAVLAEVEPLEIDEVDERVDLDGLYPAVVHVEALDLDESRHVDAPQGRVDERVRVEVDLLRVRRDVGRDGA